MERRSLILRSVYALCLLGATWNHAVMLATHGLFWDYGGVSPASATFWTMLTVVDPAAAVLLFVQPNAGIMATAAIIIVDVIHNLWIQGLDLAALLPAIIALPRLFEQILFMVFVAVTAPLAWRKREGGISHI